MQNIHGYPLPQKPHIKLKRDFGNQPFLINGEWVSRGFLVTDGLCNIMPGGVWFRTIPDAISAFYDLKNAKDPDDFWRIRHNRLGL